MPQVKCPVKGCKGFYTTTTNSNLMNHIRSIAKTELLRRYLVDDKKTKMPHAEFLKKNCRVSRKEVRVFKIGGKTFVIDEK